MNGTTPYLGPPGADVEGKIFYGVVLAEIISYHIQEYSTIEESVPVFKLSDLKSHFCKHLAEYGASEECKHNIHRIASRRKSLKKFQNSTELSKQKKGREILLTLKEETGSAIFESSSFSRKDDGRCLARATKIIRK